MQEDSNNPKSNVLLRTLSGEALSEIASSLKTISLKSGDVLYHQGEEIDRILFPHSGIISLISAIDDGRDVETASIGFEGAFGLMSGIGYHASRTKSVVQLPLIASHISSASFRRASAGNRELYKLALTSNDAFLDRIQIISGCNLLHTIEGRLSSWILRSFDRMHGSDLNQTQEMLSAILGVTRSAVSEVAAKLKALGLIQYRRGMIKVINYEGLKNFACECHKVDQKLRTIPLVD